MNIDDILKTVREAKAAKIAAETALSTAQDMLQAICKPICLSAIEEYNATTTGYKIIPSRITIGVDADKKTIGLSVRLINLRGYEPDEDFELKEVDEGVGKSFGEVLTKRLAETQLPLTYSGIAVPYTYYSK